MASYLENLTTTRDNIAANLASITASPKPSYSVDGQSFSWNEYHRMLLESLLAVNKQIAAADPFEITTESL